MVNWYRYTERVKEHTVVGDLRVCEQIYSPQLDNHRDLFVCLPPGYDEADQHYPVVYMQDGQNLFDAHTSYSGEWRVDETITTLADEGYPAIVVGLPNMGDQRRTEYSPYDFEDPDGRHQGAGALYIRFLTETVKPLIDSSFRTLPEAATTGIVGSSMGGLISLYGFVTRPDIFGLCGAFSTAYWFGDNGLLATVREHAARRGRIYLDVGTVEGETLNWFLPDLPDKDGAYVQGVRDLCNALVAAGYNAGEDLLYVEEEGARHREESWARRLPEALRFLLSTL